LNNKISDRDKKDWERFLSKKEKLPNKDLNYKTKTIIKSKTIDLHGYTLDEANKLIDNFKSYLSINLRTFVPITPVLPKILIFIR